MRIFFYGLFMDESLLSNQGVEPLRPSIGCVDGFRLRIGDRATLVSDPDHRAYGVVMDLTTKEAADLYAEESVADYSPVPVAVELLDGANVEASCYILPEGQASGMNLAYAAELLKLATRLGFPESYLAQIQRALPRRCRDG